MIALIGLGAAKGLEIFLLANYILVMYGLTFLFWFCDSHALFLNYTIMTSCHGYRLILKTMELCYLCIRVWNKVKLLQLRYYEVFSSVIRLHVKFSFTTTLHALNALSIWKTLICHFFLHPKLFPPFEIYLSIYVAELKMLISFEKKNCQCYFQYTRSEYRKECAKELLKFGVQHIIFISERYIHI